MIHVPGAAEVPLLIFSVAQTPISQPRIAASSQPHIRSVRSLPTSPPSAGDALEAITVPRPALDVDWSAEAALAAQHQTELASAAGPKSLDDHHGRKPRDGLNSSGPDQFGWDYAATHRVDTTQGAPVIHLSDRCMVAFLLILPTFACGIGGKIPADGDLFKHMHDPH
ncbi:MAG TPA: hypothetical protein VN692_19030 [Steroidobacteraceae bacterium]|nr:hypothetical protein [Steroidobacteraceae bacterium]